MIPKKIHYCWFGRGEKTRLVQKCISSWKKFCPDFEIIEWNEDNFDVYMNGYTQMCYEQKRYAFLSDYARLFIIAEHGGVYFDTDVELIKNIEMLLNESAFFCFETPQYVASGLGFGSEAHGIAIEAMLNEYNDLLDGTCGTRGCPHLNTEALVKLGLKQDGSLQYVAGARILPIDFMNPYESATGRLLKTSNTVSIHWYSASWMKKSVLMRTKLTRPFHRMFGTDCFKFLRRKK